MNEEILPPGTEKLARTVELCLWSPYVLEEKPLSLLIIAPPESGKTLLMDLYRPNQGIISAGMITRIGLVRKLGEYYENHHTYPKHIFLRDLANMLQANSAVVSDLMTILTPVAEEGLDEIHTYEIRKIFEPRLQIGIIAAVTPGVMKRRQLKDVGFFTRFIPYYHKYNKDIVVEILKAISSGYKHNNRIINGLPPENSKPVIVKCNSQYVDKFRPFIGYDERGNKVIDNDDTAGQYGFRQLRDARILLKSCALSHGHNEVQEDDFREVIELMGYIKLNYGAYLDYVKDETSRGKTVKDGHVNWGDLNNEQD